MPVLEAPDTNSTVAKKQLSSCRNDVGNQYTYQEHGEDHKLSIAKRNRARCIIHRQPCSYGGSPGQPRSGAADCPGVSPADDHGKALHHLGHVLAHRPVVPVDAILARRRRAPCAVGPHPPDGSATMGTTVIPWLSHCALAPKCVSAFHTGQPTWIPEHS